MEVLGRKARILQRPNDKEKIPRCKDFSLGVDGNNLDGDKGGSVHEGNAPRFFKFALRKKRCITSHILHTYASTQSCALGTEHDHQSHVQPFRS